MISDREGMPNVVLEYMAAALPIVVTDLPGIREMVTTRKQARSSLQTALGRLSMLFAACAGIPQERGTWAWRKDAS